MRTLPPTQAQIFGSWLYELADDVDTPSAVVEAANMLFRHLTGMSMSEALLKEEQVRQGLVKNKED